MLNGAIHGTSYQMTSQGSSLFSEEQNQIRDIPHLVLYLIGIIIYMYISNIIIFSAVRIPTQLILTDLEILIWLLIS